METIFIPKVSILTKESWMFSSLDIFSALTGFVPSTIPIFQAVKVKQENRFTTFLRTLRNSVLKHSRSDYDIISTDEDFDTLFSSETRLVLKERKKALVELVKKHESALLILREARMNCWKSKAKLQKYELILETQRSSLRYNQNEAKVREAAIQDMELVHEKWMVTHEKDHIAFEKKFLDEIKLRQKVQKISDDLSQEVVGMLIDTIRTLMNKNRQNLSDTEINKLATQVYKQTCRSYKFRNASNTPCEKVWIEKPEYLNSKINKQDIKRKTKK